MLRASRNAPDLGRGRDLTVTTTVELRSAVLDSEHIGDIRGALGTIRLDDPARRKGMSAKLKTLLAIIGPGLIVMVGDNDAGAFATYGQAGQNYGTHLLWTLLLLIPVLYVNQEMVLRLGAVTGVGHAKLIFQRFGRFWGAFSVIDLFILNALTLVTEFIGITLAAGYLGLPKIPAVILAAIVIVAAAFTGSFRRFERIAIAFCAGSLLLIPVYFMAHPAASQMGHDFVVPSMPAGSGGMATMMLLIIGIVGTTVAPWQLFFQQSYVIDKRITRRFMKYEKADLWLGIGIVIIGAAALMGASAAAFHGTRGFGSFTDTAGLAPGLSAYAGRTAGVLFAIALLDASIIGAFAVSLSTAYAIGDVFGLKHSLHRGVQGAKGFYAVYGGVIALAATIVLIPGSPLGLLTVGVQTLAGVLLPPASVFLLLLCNAKDVLGPGVHGAEPHLFPRGRGARTAPPGAPPAPPGALPPPPRHCDPADHGGLRCGRGTRRRVRHRTPPHCGDRPHRPRRQGRLADAAARRAVRSGLLHRPQDRHGRPAPPPRRRAAPRHP